MSECYVLCEGYHDRAFWAGIFRSLGCTDPGERPGGGRTVVFDPWKTAVRGGEFSFLSRSGHFIRVVPAGGKNNIPDLFKIRLKQRGQKALTHLVVNVDSDKNADGSPATSVTMDAAQFQRMITGFDGAAQIDSSGDHLIDGGTTRISLAKWGAFDPPGAGLPNQNTLERLICAAIMAVHPARGPAVQTWLDSRPEGPNPGPKEYAWSYLAGWYAHYTGYEAFCSALWSNAQIADAMRQRLKGGIWEIAEKISS
jgi:hypothetical protein